MYYGPLGLGGPDVHAVVNREVNDASKQLGYIHSLEKKLTGKDPNNPKGDEA